MKNKLTSILLSVIIAFGLWLYVVYNISQEDSNTFNISVVFEGESVLHERGLMVTSTSSTTATLHLSGSRSDLNKVNSGNITLKADLTKIYEPGTRISIDYTISYPGDVANNAFTVESKSPIYINVEERRTKEVPVEVKWTGSAPDGFMTDRENRVLDYSAITVIGPASVADLIEKAVIEVDLTDQRESISQSYRYTLCDKDGNPVDAVLITTNVEEIRLDVKIQRVKEVELKLDVTYGGGATSQNTVIGINPTTIRVSGSEAVLEELGDTIVLGKINLSEIGKSQILSFPISLPEGITNLSGMTEAEASIQFVGLSSKEFVVDQITAINVPEGMEAELITEKLTIVVRGPSADIAKLTEEDISVTVDFTGAEVGTSTYKGTVVFGDAFQTVGVVGPCSVSATVQTK